MKFCHQCGSKMDDMDIFCQACGVKSAVIPASANPPAQPYPYTPYPYMKKKIHPLAIILPIAGALIIAAVLLIVLLSPGNSPSGVVKRYFEAIKNGNYRAMIECMIPMEDEGANSWADLIGSMTKEDIISGLQAYGMAVTKEDLAQATDIQYKIVKETIDGDNATVLVEFGKPGDKSQQEIRCTKQNGKWYISLF